MEEKKFLILRQLQSVQKSAFFVAMCFSHAMVLRMGGWVRGGGWQKKYKSLKMFQKKMSKNGPPTAPTPAHWGVGKELIPRFWTDPNNFR